MIPIVFIWVSLLPINLFWYRPTPVNTQTTGLTCRIDIYLHLLYTIFLPKTLFQNPSWKIRPWFYSMVTLPIHLYVGLDMEIHFDFRNVVHKWIWRTGRATEVYCFWKSHHKLPCSGTHLYSLNYAAREIEQKYQNGWKIVCEISVCVFLHPVFISRPKTHIIINCVAERLCIW